jgi:hypothetical protein
MNSCPPSPQTRKRLRSLVLKFRGMNAPRRIFGIA